MTHILYINDNNLRLERLEKGTHEHLISSKGYAWFKEDQVVFDVNSVNAPIKYCRLAPQEMNSRYWQQCEKSSISANKAGMRHAADLIWKHLSELKKQNSIGNLILVVPSHYQSSNLQLLLGIVQSLGISVGAMVNGALLSLYDKIETDGQYAHLDVQLHQTVISHIDVLSGVARLGDVEIIQNVGIQAMQDALLKTLQTHFIQNDRFDPLHNAETEQQLFDNLSEVAVQVNRSAKATVNVNFQEQLYSTNIDAKAWNATLIPFTDELLGVVAKVKQGYIQMNGAFEHQALPVLDKPEVTLLDELSLVELPEFIALDSSGDALRYITELKLNRSASKPLHERVISTSILPSEQDKETTSKTQSIKATHLLQAGVAVLIEHAEVRMDNQQLTLHVCAKGNARALLASGELFVLNDEPRKEFRANDRVGSHLVDGVITVIQVM